MAHYGGREAKKINGITITGGPPKLKRVGHPELLRLSAKVQIRHEIYKFNPKSQKGIRAADTPAVAGVVGTADGRGPEGATHQSLRG